ncbi:MAG: hypothetical protein Q4D26_09810 [Clostridia bacterium]|nr:hypothetical protein [Clostridia bacterium]
MIYKLIDIELQKLGLLNVEKNAIHRLYVRLINDVIQIVEIELLSNKRRLRVNFDIIPIYTDLNYFGRTWKYELKKMRNNLSPLEKEYDIINQSNCFEEIINDIHKFLKPIFFEFDKTVKLLKLLIVLDNKNYRFDVYPDFRKLAIALKSKNYEYAMLILLYLKFDHVVWDYRLDFTQFVDFNDIDLKKYTCFDYEEDSFTRKIDELVYYIKNNIINEIDRYLNNNKEDMFKYLRSINYNI